MTENGSTSVKGTVEQPVPESTRGGVYFKPRVDICETDKGLTLFADLPGVHPGDVDLRYENGELVLLGRVAVPEKKEGHLLEEYEVGNYYRVFKIDESIDSTAIEADFKDGVLTVHLPKAAALRPRQISVRGS